MKMKQRDGLFWPDLPDPELDKHLPRSLDTTAMNTMMKIIPENRRRVAVQAGGSYGIWPRELAKHFDHVYTFEPDTVSFHCLVANVPPNAVCINAGLSAKGGGRTFERKSFTGHRVVEQGMVPTFSIDHLQLPYCDAIILDVEGYELAALRGAINTISDYKPIILYEEREETLEFYGVTTASITNFLFGLPGKYHLWRNIKHDNIMIPKNWKLP